MLDKKILEATREALIKYKEKTNFVDKDIPKYISGIMGALNGFVSDGMALSAEERLAYVQREIDKPNGIYEKLETGSNKKRTWSCIFALAALALQRQQSLPPNSPELEGLDQLLDTLSNGWVNSFTSWGIPKTDIIEGIKQGLSLWIDRFDVEHQDAKSTMETLLYFYTIVCSLEKTIQGSRLVPADISVLLSTLKAKVEEKYWGKKLKRML